LSDHVDPRVDAFLATLAAEEQEKVDAIREAIIGATLYAFATTIRSRVERQLFVQDLAAALDRRHLYPAGVPLEKFWTDMETRMERIRECTA
jgi:hypothetical protein